MRPSRVGSSPSMPSCRRTSSAYAATAALPSRSSSSSRSMVTCNVARATGSEARLLTGVLDIVVRCFPQNEAHQLSWPDRRLQLAPDRDDDVLGGRNHATHEGDVEVEVLVIDQVDCALLRDLLERGEVDDVAGALRHLAAHGDVEGVVVPMPVRVVAFPEQGLVLLIGERRIVHAVRRVELQAAGHDDDGHLRDGVKAWVRRDTNAKGASAVPAGLAKMAPSGRWAKENRAPRCAAGPEVELERRGFFEAQSKL